MTDTRNVKNYKRVILLYGNTNSVEHTRNVVLSNNIVLLDALHIPTIKFNLLFVNKVAETALMRVIFYSQCCLLQELET